MPGDGRRYVGAAVPRCTDERLLRGRGRYVDDVDDAGAMHAVILRSPVPHGRLTHFDAAPALAVDGVRVLGPDDIERLADPLPSSWRLPGQEPGQVALISRTLRYAGQPVGVVMAPDRAAAEDAAELVRLAIDPLPFVLAPDAALREDAPLLYPEHGTNVVGQIHFGDPRDELEEAIAHAARVVERRMAIARVAPSSMEPRGVLAEWVEATRQLTVWTSSQVPYAVRQSLSASLRLRMDQVRVIVPDVGGAFGGKTSLHVDEALVCLAAKAMCARVKWIEDRAENLVASYQGRGQQAHARLALDPDARFIAFHAQITGDLGAFASQAGSGPFQVTGLALEGPYRFSLAGTSVTGVYTNTVPTGSYRGYGIQEAAWIRERLIDEAARELGLDALEIRSRNIIRASQLPYTTRTGLTYDSGDYGAALVRAAELAGSRRRPSAGTLRRGVGVACGVEITGFAPSALLEAFQIDWSGWESGRIRVNEDGTVTVFSGVTGVGQGIETALAQVVADALEIPIEWISVQLGDTATSPHSDLAAQASRSAALAGAALTQAGQRIRERMDRLAASKLGVPVEDVKRDGAVFQAGITGARVTWQEIARRGWKGWGEHSPGRIQLEETVDFDPPEITYSYSAHGAAVAVDTETGHVTVEDYWSVNDSGVLINPPIANGQIAGGIAQGIGIALIEEVEHDPRTGRPVGGTWADYLIPRSSDVPDTVIEHLCTPSTIIPGGFKGLGESGIIPSPAAIGNAIAAAVPEIGPEIVATPMSAGRIWHALQRAETGHD